MPRPASFDEAAKRKRKNKTGRGKDFEGEIQRSLKRLPGFTRRFPDILNVNNEGHRKDISAASPPDYIHIGPKFQLLVECKAVKGDKDSSNLPTSVRFDTVAPHQIDDLLEFDAVGPRAHGLIAFCLYNDGVKRAWMIPVLEWIGAMEALGFDRSSVPLSWFTEGETWLPYEIEWLPGKAGSCYDLTQRTFQRS